MTTIELYAENSYRKECTANILSIQERFVVCNQTVFYPGGGGQPCDRGIIKQFGEIYEVVNAKKIDGQIVHELNRQLQCTQQEVRMEIDWPWRYQNMKYHTLLHMISGYFYQQYGALATSSQIEADHARLELAFSPEIVSVIPFEHIEKSLKEAFIQPQQVRTKTMSRREAEQNAGILKTYLNILPASLTEIRVVEIDQIDEQACGGTHVNNTSEIGDFSIVKIQNKGATKKRMRIQLLD
ncbi:alanyl-tRNA editing protein [Brevibacillus composti]|uniref:Alanyl-tRNA editing protein n=1 Tax=Brevibacillus composti TaxID=2796470 RepID=A0A7T5JPC4_9BACL|nr:alanyl-tRNA editing protein [Brevibacillus composti]QQE75328.1 alanyl-tRNA editing protein [Brevibacillus composti]QUO42354.1 alanyl-tRNA editing protein [Brevibacillus composti]